MSASVSSAFGVPARPCIYPLGACRVLYDIWTSLATPPLLSAPLGLASAAGRHANPVSTLTLGRRARLGQAPCAKQTAIKLLYILID